MKNTNPPSKQPFDATTSAPNFRAPIAVLPDLPRLNFPSLDQVLVHPSSPHPLLQLSETPPPSSVSLFQGLLGGRLEVLVQDSIDHPERYDEPTRLMLQELAAGASKLEELTAAERGILDRATMDFAAYRPPQAPKNAPKPQPPMKKPRLVEAADALEDGRAPQVEEPGGTMTPYWWL
jgi:hypothetical protein